jgi:hypothetical protein
MVAYRFLPDLAEKKLGIINFLAQAVCSRLLEQRMLAPYNPLF